MNYRHAYHAGNFADVVKHIILALIMDYLGRKEAPFVVIDGHAGIGVYDLAGIEAGKTGEWLNGLGRIAGRADLPPALAPWLDAVRALNGGDALARYPGSPWLARLLTRPQDRLVLCEKHPEDFAILRAKFLDESRARVTCADAYATVKAAVPPPERRGLVVLDPPFEETDEFIKLSRGLGQALKRWPTGTYVIWYPIKTRAPVERFLGDLLTLNPPETLVAEVMLTDGSDPNRLNGCGLAIINPPWILHDQLTQALPWLAEVLGDGNGSHRLEMLNPGS